MQPENGAGILKILSVTPLESDHQYLRAVVGHSKWMLLNSDAAAAALALLRQYDISVIVCERDLRPGTWQDVLEGIRDLPHPPSLIVTSHLADERLWAEALNLGAWDVLAKPFDRTEVLRSIKAAWQHWDYQAKAAVRENTSLRAAC
jgi:DNA-binding response OmpR family regulator